MVYEEAIRLLGQFLDEINNKIRRQFRRFHKSLPEKDNEGAQPKFRRHRKKATFTIHKKPDTTQQVFVRHNAPTGSLQMPYGPYQVLSRSEKTRYESMDDPCHWTG